MTLPDLPQAGSATRPPRARRLPAWVVLLAALALARRSWTPDRQDDLSHWLGPDETYPRAGPLRLRNVPPPLAAS